MVTGFSNVICSQFLRTCSFRLLVALPNTWTMPRFQGIYILFSYIVMSTQQFLSLIHSYSRFFLSVSTDNVLFENSFVKTPSFFFHDTLFQISLQTHTFKKFQIPCLILIIESSRPNRYTRDANMEHCPCIRRYSPTSHSEYLYFGWGGGGRGQARNGIL
jgi:hypothetical protein